MLLIIHNLPPNTRYADVKTLIKDKCGLTEMIVDNLIAEGKGKKVTVGLADEGDAALLMRTINRLYVSNHQLYVENVRQKKSNEPPYRPGSMDNQFDKNPFNQGPQPQFDNQFYGQQDAVQFQPPPLMSMEPQLPCPPAPNFGVPFYMTAQNKNVGNNLQFMVQYPKVQGSMGNESYEGRDIGFDQQYGRRKEDQSMSPDRGHRRELSPRRSSRWNESDCDRSDGRQGRDRPAQRNDRFDADQSYKDKSYRDSFQSKSNQDFRPNTNRFEKPFSRSDPNWEGPDRSSFGEQNEPYRFNDNRNVNLQDRRYNQQQEPQRFRGNNHSQSHGSDYGQPGDFSKKRPYESPDKNKFTPQKKKFGSNEQFYSRNEHTQGPSNSSFSNQNKKNAYIKNPPVRTQQGGHQMPHKGLQRNKPQWQPNNTPMKHSKKQAKITKNRPGPSEFKEPTEEMIARHEAWRVQASSLIATQILNNVGRTRKKRDPVLATLKACVRARIDVITGEDMSINLKDMLSNYREKFQDDDAFFNAVLEKAKSGEQDDFKNEDKEKKSVEIAAKKKVEIKPKTQFIGKAPAKVPMGDNQRLPKYPNDDKKLLSQMKQAQKDEMLCETLYNLDAVHEKVLAEEFDKIDELIKKEFENPANEMEKSITAFMKNVFLPDVRKVLTLHVRKRILDVRTNLSIRVICQYKPPNRDLLDSFLKDYGVVSLKSSDKNRNVYVAICESYESFDALCKLEFTVIDNLKISFKPLHITGPPIKTKFKRQGANVTNITTTESNKKNDDNVAVIEDESGNIDEEINEGNENQKEVESECDIISSNKSEDVIILEDNVIKSQDVITIDQSDDKDVIIVDKAPSIIIDQNDENDSAIPDKAPSTNAVSEAVPGDACGINKESVAVNGEGVILDDDKVAIITDNPIIDNEEPELIENDNIADDDLEDF